RTLWEPRSAWIVIHVVGRVQFTHYGHVALIERLLDPATHEGFVLVSRHRKPPFDVPVGCAFRRSGKIRWHSARPSLGNRAILAAFTTAPCLVGLLSCLTEQMCSSRAACVGWRVEG